MKAKVSIFIAIINQWQLTLSEVLLGWLNELHGHNLVSTLLESGDYLSDESTLDPVGLHDEQAKKKKKHQISNAANSRLDKERLLRAREEDQDVP
jgi:hypothetical protein